MIPAAIRLPDSSDAELKAFDTTCERLSGFDDELDFESIDGFLSGLAAGPRLPALEEWLPALCGDAFERAFADPEDHAQALRPLQARLAVLCRQLDPEAMLDRPDEMRLLPLVSEITDADRQRLVEEGVMTAEDAALVQTGALWAQGFVDAMAAFPEIWVEPADEAAAADFGALVDQITALLLPPGSDEAREHAALYWPQGEPTHDELLAEACWAVQDLRLYWVDHAPRPATRRVAPAPGRNDPCPCGSGKKFKKCHGAAAAA
ncbi:MAG: UPF0149 family protein [Rubrivivax sp.]|nr:UPF0149 family protein [Rubrivivax sp.]